MKFTLNWLKEFVEVDTTPQQLAAMLTMAGLEVESVAPLREPENGQEDWLFEIAVTANRGDCLGIAGIAREVAALTGAQAMSPRISPHGKEGSTARRVAIAIEDPQLCARYSARIVDHVEIGGSPLWLKYRLESCGIRPINNVVDVTNYVMLESGQPLHAFDLEKLNHKQIVVRPAGMAKKFATLDGMERELAAEDLLICDGGDPIALAGVMGGKDSEVSAVTRSVLLESANFAPLTIRRTAKRLALHSEASHRFERGVDPDGTVAALNRAVYLLGEIAAGQAEAGLADRYPGRAKPPTILLREPHIERLLGLKIERAEAAKLLAALGLQTRDHPRRRSLTVVPPTSRPDLTREADIIEEIARLHGYDRIPTTLPLLRSSAGRRDWRLDWERKLRHVLTGEGLSEVINLPFTADSLNQNFPGLWRDATAPVSLLNPLAKENAEMRQSLLPGLIENLRLNLAHKAGGFHGYHLGKVFCSGSGGETVERSCLAGLLYGPRARHGLRFGKEAPLDFLQSKGVVEAVLQAFCLDERVSWSPCDAAFLHPGQAASFGSAEAQLGYLGQLHPDYADHFELPTFFVFELDLEKLLEYAPRRIGVRSLPRFPAVVRDVALVVDRDFASQQVISWIKNLGEALIEHVEVFDQYLGPPVPEGKKSLAYKVSYRAEDRTLTDMEINELHERLVDRLGKVFGAEQRA
jgi:phenylalanyl-tRNA synthetase beta chain